MTLLLAALNAREATETLVRCGFPPLSATQRVGKACRAVLGDVLEPEPVLAHAPMSEAHGIRPEPVPDVPDNWSEAQTDDQDPEEVLP